MPNRKPSAPIDPTGESEVTTASLTRSVSSAPPLPAARATLDMLSELDISVVIPGHGVPFTDVAAAIARARRRLEAYEADSLRVARHVLKVNFAFVLLDRQSMAVSDLPAYLDRIGLYRDFNRQFFHLPPVAFAEFLVGELEKASAVRRENGFLVPAAAAAG